MEGGMGRLSEPAPTVHSTTCTPAGFFVPRPPVTTISPEANSGTQCIQLVLEHGK